VDGEGVDHDHDREVEMEAAMMTGMVEEGCNFAKRSGMKVREVTEDGRIDMVLEDVAANMNAFGLTHAGAICGLVETAGGMAIFHHLDPRQFIVLNTVLNIRFVAMPSGELSCKAKVTGGEALDLLEELRHSGKADKSIDIKVMDAGGKMVAQAHATFRLMPTPEKFKATFEAMMG
jgi:acyl-coenzyme A thioesterase PaaI-like protein